MLGAALHCVDVALDDDDRVLITAKEAARLLSVEPALVYHWAALGLIERRYIGSRHFRIPLDSLREFVDQMPDEPRESI